MGIYSMISGMKKEYKARMMARDNEMFKVQKRELEELIKEKEALEANAKLRDDLKKTKRDINRAKHPTMYAIAEKVSARMKEKKKAIKAEKKKGYNPFGNNKSPFDNKGSNSSFDNSNNPWKKL